MSPMSPRLLRPRASGAFTPRSLSGLAAWFDADDASTITLNGSAVSEWRDKSGNNRHATQATPSRQPTYTTNSLNGKPAVTATGDTTGNKGLLTAAWTYTAGNTALFVFRASALNQAIYQRGLVNDQPRGAVQGSPDLTLRATLGGTNGTQINSIAPYVANNWAIGATVVNTNLARAYVNGVYAADATGNTQTWSTSTSLRLLSLTDSLYTINGGIAEFIYYDRQLTASEVERVALYLSRKWNISLAPQVSNADAQDWINRVYSNGGTVSTSTAAAVNTFCNSIDAAGLRDRFYRLNLFAGTGLSAALVPLYRGQSLGGTQFGNTTDTNANFVSGDYAETGSSGGLRGNTNSKYLNPGFTPNTLPFGNAHLCAYLNLVPTTNFAAIAQALSASGGDELGLVSTQGSTSTPSFFSEENTATGFVQAATNNAAGMILGSSISTTDRRIYVNASQSGSTVTNALTRTQYSNQQIFIMARNFQGSPTGYNNGRICGYSIGLGMTAAQVSSYYTAMQAFQAALSRNV